MAEPIIRLVRPSDINAVQALDLKCYHYPMPLEMWQEKCKASGKDGEAKVVVCQAAAIPIGFCMWVVDKEHEAGMVLRLGVLPRFRQKGVGRLLMETAVRDCNRALCEKIKVVIPHIHCVPGDPDDVSVFLNKVGFAPTGKIIHDWREMYGQEVDGYEFERKIDAFASGIQG